MEGTKVYVSVHWVNDKDFIRRFDSPMHARDDFNFHSTNGKLGGATTAASVFRLTPKGCDMLDTWEWNGADNVNRD